MGFVPKGEIWPLVTSVEQPCNHPQDPGVLLHSEPDLLSSPKAHEYLQEVCMALA